MRRRNPLGTLERLPKGARMWEAVYRSALDRGFSEERSAQQAWGTVKRAGYWQDEDDVWHAPKAANPEPMRDEAPASNPAPTPLSGPLRIESRRDGLWVVGQGVAIPVESRSEARKVKQSLQRRKNPSDLTRVEFKSVEDLAEGLQVMDVQLRPFRHHRPLVFRVDWPDCTIWLEGPADDPGVDAALHALDYAKVRFRSGAAPYAANPDRGRTEAAGYAFVGNLLGSLLGFGMGALIGAAAGAMAAGGVGAAAGGTILGSLGSYTGGIVGASSGAQRGAPKGQERDAMWGAGIGAAVPYVGVLLAPLGAYLVTEDRKKR